MRMEARAERVRDAADVAGHQFRVGGRTAWQAGADCDSHAKEVKTSTPAKTHSTTNQRQVLTVLVNVIAKKGQ